MNNKNILTAIALTLIGALVLWALPTVAHEDEAQDEHESVLTLEMGEFYFQLEGQQPGEAITLEAGQEYKLRLLNVGAIEHEVMIGQGERFMEDGMRHGYLNDFFGMLTEFTLEPNNEVVLEFEVPESYAGQTFEIGCFIPGHYQAGMKLDLIITAPDAHADEADHDADHVDTDGDGIPDDDDYCPTFPGEELKNGC